MGDSYDCNDEKTLPLSEQYSDTERRRHNSLLRWWKVMAAWFF